MGSVSPPLNLFLCGYWPSLRRNFPLWLFKDFSPNFLNLFLLPSHTTSLFLSRQLHFCLPFFFTLFLTLSHSLSRSINQHSNNNNNNSNNHCYYLPYWAPISVGLCPWKAVWRCLLKSEVKVSLSPFYRWGKIKPRDASYYSYITWH